jgi:hypothetical protein
MGTDDGQASFVLRYVFFFVLSFFHLTNDLHRSKCKTKKTTMAMAMAMVTIKLEVATIWAQTTAKRRLC